MFGGEGYDGGWPWWLERVLAADGAKFGTGYCDAQCPHDIKWMDGEANVDG